MKTSEKRETRPPWSEDFDAALTERDQVLKDYPSPQNKPSLRVQLVTGLKLFATAASIGMALWVLDLMVSG
jgi:hypothetical protein